MDLVTTMERAVQVTFNTLDLIQAARRVDWQKWFPLLFQEILQILISWGVLCGSLAKNFVEVVILQVILWWLPPINTGSNRA